MLSFLEKILKNKFCKSYEYCTLKYFRNENEKLKKELYSLQIVLENFPFICNYVNVENQTIYINLSSDNNGIIYAYCTLNGNKITCIDFYGRFNINSLSRVNVQRIYTEFKYDKDGIAYCELIDFQCAGNRGYGTIMMTCLINYLQHFNVSYIKGFISTFDVTDTNDKEHNNRLHHFYKKFGFYFYIKGDVEYIRLNLPKDDKLCSRKYIEQSIYEEENSCYKELVANLLISNNLHLSDLSRTLRINNPNYYIYALKVCSTVENMIDNLTLLCKDIDSLENKSPERDYLLKRLNLFINPIRYFEDNESMILFAKKAKDKYLAQYENE